MFGFDLDYDEEQNFHRRLSLFILFVSALAAKHMLLKPSATYGKHLTAGQKKAPGDQKSSPSTNDVASNGNSSNPSASSLRQRRGLSDNEKTHSDTGNGVATTNGTTQQQKQEKHQFGPLLPASLAWVVFESPCWIWAVICLYDFYYGNGENDGPKVLPFRNQMLLGWFTFHYLYRSLWYPLVMVRQTEQKNSQKSWPLGIAVAAWFYCTMNGYLQARGLTRFNVPSQDDNQFWFGIMCTMVGFYIVITSDKILLRLKHEKQQKMALRQSKGSSNGSSSHYAVPRGGLFEYVSSPHYFGEMIEWAGFCIANNYSLASFSFLVLTASNLVPRAIQTHTWYKEKFSGKKEDAGEDLDENVDYSQLGRKAIIPFIL